MAHRVREMWSNWRRIMQFNVWILLRVLSVSFHIFFYSLYFFCSSFEIQTKERNQRRKFSLEFFQLFQYFLFCSNDISFVVSWLAKNVKKWKDNPFGGELVRETQVGGSFMFLYFVCWKIKEFEKKTVSRKLLKYFCYLSRIGIAWCSASKRAWQRESNEVFLFNSSFI